MNGAVIQEYPCPRCSNRRTIRLGTTENSFCFNCRHAFAGRRAASTLLRHIFGPSELARLERYRAAIQAGVFSDGTSSDAHAQTYP
jgi:hypothetical protein